MEPSPILIGIPLFEFLGAGLALLAALMLSITAVCIRVGSQDGGAKQAVLVVLLINTIVLLPLSILIYHGQYGLNWTSLPAFIGAGIIGTLLGRLFYYSGIERVGASRAEPIVASTPFHAALIAVVFLGETLTGPHFIGILLIIAGVAIISWAGVSDKTQTPGNTSTIGFLLPLIAAFCFGLEPVFAQIGLGEGTPALVGAMIKAISALVGFASYFYLRDALSELTSIHPRSIRWYSLAGVANTIFLVTYYVALTVAPVVVVVPLMYTTPLFVAAISYVFLQRLEKVTLRLIGASLIVVVGAVLVTVFN